MTTRTTVGQLLAAMKADAHTDYPVGALSALLHSLIVLLPESELDPGELAELLELPVRVNAGGAVELDESSRFALTSPCAIELMRQQLSGHVLPAPMARLLLAKPPPTLERIEAVVAQLASAQELADAVASGVRLSTGASPPAGASASAARAGSEASLDVASSRTAARARKADRSARRAAREADPQTRSATREAGHSTWTAAREADFSSVLDPKSAAVKVRPSSRMRWVLLMALGLAGVCLGISTLISTGTEARGEPASPGASGAHPGTGGAGQGSNDPATGGPAPIVRGPDWTDILVRLDSARNAALETVNPAKLEEVSVPNSLAAAQDRQLVEELKEAGVKPVGMTMQLLSVHATEETASAAVLKVRDIRGAYQLIPLAGPTAGKIERIPARPALDWTVRLKMIGGNWRIESVEQLK